jgi:mono/diheme cytochrome c family protein
VIAAIAFVIVFAGIGLTVIFLAFGGGARGVREELLHRQSRASRRVASLVTALAIAAFGVAIPAVVLAVNHDHQSKQSSGGVDLTAAQQEGRKLFARNCSTCHTLSGANAVGRVGPNLDQLRPPKGLVLDAIRNGRARGNGQMPAELLDGQDARDVADFVAAAAGRSK